MIKPENERITITIDPEEKKFLNTIMQKWKIKTYGKAIKYIIEVAIMYAYYIETHEKDA